ncbi:hypothetical protein D9M72_493520 [compost metagenome]
MLGRDRARQQQRRRHAAAGQAEVRADQRQRQRERRAPGRQQRQRDRRRQQVAPARIGPRQQAAEQEFQHQRIARHRQPWRCERIALRGIGDQRAEAPPGQHQRCQREQCQHHPQRAPPGQQQPERERGVERDLVVERPAHVQRRIAVVRRVVGGGGQERQRRGEQRRRHRIEQQRVQHRHGPVRRRQPERAADQEAERTLRARPRQHRDPRDDEAADDEEHIDADMAALDHVGGQPAQHGGVGPAQREAGVVDHREGRGQAAQRLDAVEPGDGRGGAGGGGSFGGAGARSGPHGAWRCWRTRHRMVAFWNSRRHCFSGRNPQAMNP